MEQVTASREALDRTYDLLNDAECSHDAHVRFAAYYDESEAEKTALRQAKDEEIARRVEALGEALHGLSARLLLANALENDETHVAYEEVVKRFAALGASDA